MKRALALSSSLLLTAFVSATASEDRQCAHLNANRYCVPAGSLIKQPAPFEGFAVRTTVRDLLEEDLLYDQSAAFVSIFITVGAKRWAAGKWQRLWSESPNSTKTAASAGRVEKTGPSVLTIQNMPDGTELLIPQQDLEAVPIGFAECKASARQCSLYFDVGDVHWQVQFPRERRLQLLEIRRATIAYLERFAAND
ncbi:hypothetical protein [Sinorhizobium meliloti]|uniref:hypothetical protein n=1 Tax=Rhizobium meliloti TaxID=382 RepID=UPI003F164173